MNWIRARSCCEALLGIRHGILSFQRIKYFCTISSTSMIKWWVGMVGVWLIAYWYLIWWHLFSVSNSNCVSRWTALRNAKMIDFFVGVDKLLIYLVWVTVIKMKWTHIHCIAYDNICWGDITSHKWCTSDWLVASITFTPHVYTTINHIYRWFPPFSNTKLTIQPLCTNRTLETWPRLETKLVLSRKLKTIPEPPAPSCMCI